MPAIVVKMIGGLAPTFLLSRIFVWLFRARRPVTFVLVHIVSWLVAAAIAGWGASDGGPYRWDAGFTYIVPQLFWLLVDLYRSKAQPV